MNTKLLPLFEKKFAEFGREDQKRFAHLLDKIKVCDSFEEVLTLLVPVKAVLGRMPVYMVRLSPVLRATFTLKDEVIYFISVIDKRES
jgi:hypothetical protein